jgi:O-antigen/teichoic acid export membrane protein
MSEPIPTDPAPAPPPGLLRRSVAFLGATGGGTLSRVLRAGTWVMFGSAGQSILQFVRQVFLARLLSPEAFGLMGLCLVFTRFLEVFTILGIGASLIHRQERVEDAKNTAYTLQVLRGLVLAVAILPIAPFAARFYEEPQLRDLMFVLAIVFVLEGSTNIQLVLLQKKLDFRTITTYELLVAVCGSVSVVALAFWFRSVWAMVIGNVVTAAVRLVLSFWLVPGRPTFRFDRQIAGELFRYGRYITGFTVLAFFVSEIDNLFVGKMLGAEQLGLYTMAFVLGNLPATSIAKTAAQVIFPAYSMLQNDPAALRRAYLTVVRTVAGLAVPAAAGLAILAPDVIHVVYGPKWAAAATALSILAILGAGRAFNVIGGYLFNAVGKPDIPFYMTSVKLAVILVTIYPLTRAYGIEGAAISVTVPQLVEPCVGLFLVRRQLQLDAGTLAVIVGRIVAASAVMVGAVALCRRWLPVTGPFQLLALVLVGVVVYAAISAREIRSLIAELRGGRAGAPAVGTA